jgi:hypothetical protein
MKVTGIPEPNIEHRRTPVLAWSGVLKPTIPGSDFRDLRRPWVGTTPIRQENPSRAIGFQGTIHFRACAVCVVVGYLARSSNTQGCLELRYQRIDEALGKVGIRADL